MPLTLFHHPVPLFAANLQIDSGIFAGKTQVMSVHSAYASGHLWCGEYAIFLPLLIVRSSATHVGAADRRLQTLLTVLLIVSPDVPQRVQTMEQIVGTLHAYLTLARQYVQDVRQRINPMTTGEESCMS
jgi:hypothetical protein